MRLSLSVAVAMLAGLAIVGDFFLAPSVPIGFALVDTVTIIVAFALLLGLANLARHHIGTVLQGEGDRLASGALLLALIGVVVAGFWPGASGPNAPPVRWIFDYVYTPISATLFALLAFYVVTAAYRTLRARRPESGLLAVGAALALVAAVPLAGPELAGVQAVQQWVLDYPVLAAMRGLTLGIAIGTLGASFRILAGVDRQYLE